MICEHGLRQGIISLTKLNFIRKNVTIKLLKIIAKPVVNSSFQVSLLCIHMKCQCYGYTLSLFQNCLINNDNETLYT